MKNILLVFGGKSYEHDISVVTASQIYGKVKSEQFKLIPLYISRDNKMFVYEKEKFDVNDFSKLKFSGKNKKFKEVVFVSGENNKLFARTIFGLKEYIGVEVAIFACHGNAGENGKLVAVFEQMNIACSAGGVDALGVCMNKFLFKQVMKGLKIPTVKGFKIKKNQFQNKEDSIIDLKLRFLEFPVVLKVNNGGSSIGVFVAKNKEEFDKFMVQAFEFDDVVLVEKLIENAREFNVAVIGTSDEYEISEIDEPLKNGELLSFADKYLTGEKQCCGCKGKLGSMEGLKKNFPAKISNELKEKLQKYAGRIFEELGLCGVVRIDFLYDEENNKIYVCEVNAIPGSLAYYFFERGKVLINEFIDKLVKIAEKQRDYTHNFNDDFVTEVLGWDIDSS